MNKLRDWLDQPQRVGLRKAVFKVHRWTGVVVALYLILVCGTGSALVFHWEMELAPAPEVAVSAEPVDYDKLAALAEAAHPGFRTVGFMASPGPGVVAEVFLENRKNAEDRLARFIDPGTGKDLGLASLHGFLHWLAQLHKNLLGGDTGLLMNGIGGFSLVLMSLTGLVIWWPGRANWRRGMTVKWNAGRKRVIWDLHRATGFWTVSLLLMWGLTGAFFVFPQPFRAAFCWFTPATAPIEDPPDPTPTPERPYLPMSQILAAADKAVPGTRATWIQMPGPDVTLLRLIRHETFEPWAPHNWNVYVNSHTAEVVSIDVSHSAGDKAQRWMGYLHFGNFGGPVVKALWVILGLAPVLLAVTGLYTWRNRVLRSRRPVAQVE